MGRMRTRVMDRSAERQADRIADAVVRGPTPQFGAVPSRAHDDLTAGFAAPLVESTLRRPGAPLDPAAQNLLGPRVDLSRVRVHADPSAADSARSIGAHAYTVGDHVVFDEGRYAPH